MGMKVLQDRSQINKARQEMIKKGVSFVDSDLKSLIRRMRILPGMAIGDALKSWDVLSTLDFIEKHIQKHEPILDIGCYASEVLVALCKLGYSDLTGIDLNVKLKKMPCQGRIKYEIGDFMHTKFKDSSFKAITSISVIEHGFNPSLLLKEISRLLKQDGYFIASFDYWPEKIDTEGIDFFGMDWRIFSKDEINNFITEAAYYDLVPAGKLVYDARDKVIDYWKKQYTIGWLVFKKSG